MLSRSLSTCPSNHVTRSVHSISHVVHAIHSSARSTHIIVSTPRMFARQSTLRLCLPTTARQPRVNVIPRLALTTTTNTTTAAAFRSFSDAESLVPEVSKRRREPKVVKVTTDDGNDRRARNQPRPSTPPHLLTLADLSIDQLQSILRTALAFKILNRRSVRESLPRQKTTPFYGSLLGNTVALIFSKRSTRTRVASETSIASLGGHSMFLGKEDIQLGVNETLEDSAKVIGSMVDGIMARVFAHEEVEALANGSGVPVINALSDLWHPTQILADLLTMYEMFTPNHSNWLSNLEIYPTAPQQSALRQVNKLDILESFKGKKVAWVGDTNNVLNDMLVTFPRLGMTISVASPKGYDKVDDRVWKRVIEGGHSDKVILTNSPEEALKDADIAVTDTWISMGQEDEKATRLSAFAGYQITESLCTKAGAKPDWKFMHCLPRKQEEVDDDVFYGKRSVVFQEAENRKWTIMACFDHLIGRWKI